MLPSTSQSRAYPDSRPPVSDGVSLSEGRSTSRSVSSWWISITRTWSPRPYVRVDSRGEHSYAVCHELSAGAPAAGVPYALHLTDERGFYRLLAFDFDAHHDGRTAAADATDLSARLGRAGVPHVVCQSGPSGGMHVWVRLTGATPARAVAQLATRLRTAYASLDIGALCNPTTGCVRPPGAPHRGGGVSTPLGTTHIEPAALTDLAAALADLPTPGGRTPEAAAAPVAVTPVLTDLEGMPRLSGPRRPLSPTLRSLARRPLTTGADASAIAFSILLGMAHARMSFTDATDAAFTACWPGLEHLRTTTGPAARTPRTGQEDHLRRQWASAVTAASLTGPPANTTSPARALAETQAATLLQAMDAHADRWRGKTGAQDRLLLCALAQHLIDAAAPEAHFSERCWALKAGLSRDTVHDRLPHLMREGWIRRTRTSAGPWAARWSLSLGGGKTSSGAVFTPSVRKHLAGVLRSAQADVWHAPELGVLGWRVWSELRSGWRPVAELARRVGVCAATVRRKLACLKRLRLVTGDGRAYAHRSRMRAAAEAAGVWGARADRRRLYQLHSAVFVWWFTARYQPHRLDGEPADALTEWGTYPTEDAAAEVHPDDIALAYGADSHSPPTEATQWAAAMVAQETHRHTDPDYWWQLVADARAALPPEDLLVPAYQPHTLAA